MSRVGSIWHLSRLLLLLSTSQALQRYLLVLLIALATIRGAITCDQRTRRNVNDPQNGYLPRETTTESGYPPDKTNMGQQLWSKSAHPILRSIVEPWKNGKSGVENWRIPQSGHQSERSTINVREFEHPGRKIAVDRERWMQQEYPAIKITEDPSASLTSANSHYNYYRSPPSTDYHQDPPTWLPLNSQSYSATSSTDAGSRWSASNPARNCDHPPKDRNQLVRVNLPVRSELSESQPKTVEIESTEVISEGSVSKNGEHFITTRSLDFQQEPEASSRHSDKVQVRVRNNHEMPEIASDLTGDNELDFLDKTNSSSNRDKKNHNNISEDEYQLMNHFEESEEYLQDLPKVTDYVDADDEISNTSPVFRDIVNEHKNKVSSSVNLNDTPNMELNARPMALRLVRINGTSEKEDEEAEEAEEEEDEAESEEEDPPFTGFEGSQKIPKRMTYKPPVAPQVEKFDRRRFGPPKETLPEESNPTTNPVALDLPKSPSRDVPLRPKPEQIPRMTNDNESVDLNQENSTDTDDLYNLVAPDPEDKKLEFDQTEQNDSVFDTRKKDWTNRETDPTSRGTTDFRLDGRNFSDGHGDDDDGSLWTSTISTTISTGANSDWLTREDENGAVKSMEKINVTILGLFEMTDGPEPRPEGSSELQAAWLAVERVNRMDVIPSFHLRLIYNDTKCDAGVAVDRFFNALYTSEKGDLMPLLLGSASSEVTETLAKIVPYWNIIQVSFGSTAPALSDATEFPLFLRTVAPDSSHNPARIALIKHFGWDTVTALSQTGDMYSLAVNDLVTELEEANITCTATITFAENDYKEQLQTLKNLDTRIIIGSFSPRLAPRVFCEAWRLGMHSGDYAWILPDDTIDLSGMTGDWWQPVPDDCTPSQLSQTLNGLIIVKSHGNILDDEISSSGLTSGEFISELAKRGVTQSRFAGQTYDAVWAMAMALAKTEAILNQKNTSITHYNHTRKDFAHQLLEQLKMLKFIGVSGPVSFDGADRVGITAFYQMQGPTIKRIAIFTPNDGQLLMNCPGCAFSRWPGGQPPAARRVFRLRIVTVAPAAFLAVTCFASVGVTLALAFLAFNLHFRKHKSIKLSSPRLNNMAAVGCGLVYGAVILLGLDHATLPDSDGYFPAICTARVYLLSAGFSLAFGSMFTKTYRVHRIFTRSRSGVVKNKLLQDTQLISLICVLLLIDGLVVTLWVTLDPMQRHLRNLTLEINPQDRGVVYQPQVEVCRSQHTTGWLGALYAYKGLLLVVGVYMAWETRHVKIPALNDSQYIGMSVYSVVITSGIVVVLANLMSDRATLAFVTITTLILASTTSTLALLFLPQLANILGGERADPVVQSLGLKIECNTRRFVTDDRRELQYRVEVQNRVYRREMAQLELELARLEKQLGQDPMEPSHASSSTSIPQRNPSISGGLPLLLLSVLPPVIPRASWPSAQSAGMRRGTVAFSSQPDLEPSSPRRSLADIYKIQRRETEGPNRLGVFQQIFRIFGSRPNSRKTSTASFTGVASALRAHMGYIAGLVPGTKAASTCQVNTQGTRSPHPRCGSGPIINITTDEDRRFSLGLRRKESSEPRVNFSLPPQAGNQGSSREKIKGSPRFPHRIVPANSLGALSLGASASRPHRWHSMEDASRPKTMITPRGSTCSPSSDVWATHEVGIPLSELANSVRGQKPPEILPLTITANSEYYPDSFLRSANVAASRLESKSAKSSLTSSPTTLGIPAAQPVILLRKGENSQDDRCIIQQAEQLSQSRSRIQINDDIEVPRDRDTGNNRKDRCGLGEAQVEFKDEKSLISSVLRAPRSDLAPPDKTLLRKAKDSCNADKSHAEDLHPSSCQVLVGKIHSPINESGEVEAKTAVSCEDSKSDSK
ncbi:LOW QUALITY PROTEIN: uncharacterized protein GABA-B-R3 [Prorops nasuta]|uniref:LOW QUALITY PROTEIN: uncharacterized protein GABA-B-R3 n=1 Tax=Prorops nasuta TaxID=863751 RepID=UPI0034CD88F4